MALWDTCARIFRLIFIFTQKCRYLQALDIFPLINQPASIHAEYLGETMKRLSYLCTAALVVCAANAMSREANAQTYPCVTQHIVKYCMCG